MRTRFAIPTAGVAPRRRADRKSAARQYRDRESLPLFKDGVEERSFRVANRARKRSVDSTRLAGAKWMAALLRTRPCERRTHGALSGIAGASKTAGEVRFLSNRASAIPPANFSRGMNPAARFAPGFWIRLPRIGIMEAQADSGDLIFRAAR
jgi:hypothetical protein